MGKVMPVESILRAFGIFGTNAPTISLDSADDLMDAFRRYIFSSNDPYTLEEFKGFIATVRQSGCLTPGLEYYGHLIETYVRRVPDLGWERCARQVWPLLEECKRWIEERAIPFGKLGVRPAFSAVQGYPGTYEIKAFLCNHSAGGSCDCGVHHIQ